jgi:small subunit ribosomal protein S1
MSEPEVESMLDDTTTGTALTAREKRDLQRSQLRPLANRRPELYEEDDRDVPGHDGLDRRR